MLQKNQLPVLLSVMNPVDPTPLFSIVQEQIIKISLFDSSV